MAALAASRRPVVQKARRLGRAFCMGEPREAGVYPVGRV
jgi:hypothetical protein